VLPHPENEKSRSHKLAWELDREKIKAEEEIDGCYVIRSDVSPERMDAAGIVAAYKNLGHVERAFRNLKTVQLEMRPVYHKTDKRIRAHVFLCMLAYYVQWHMKQRLEPLFDEDGSGSDRRWTFQGIIDRLKQRSRHTVAMKGIEYQQDGEPDGQQRRIIALLSGKT